MEKLKDILQESKYLKREFGDKLPTLDSVMKQHQESKESIKEYIDLGDPVRDVRDHLKNFSKDLDNKRLGSFDGDSGEYHGFEGGDDKLYATRYKKMSAWEKKVHLDLPRENLVIHYLHLKM